MADKKKPERLDVMANGSDPVEDDTHDPIWDEIQRKKAERKFAKKAHVRRSRATM